MSKESLLYTREQLLRVYGEMHLHGEKPLTDAHINIIQERQLERNPEWKRGDLLLVYRDDITEATGAYA